MAKLGFFFGTAGVSIGGFGAGAFNMYIAWDPYGIGKDSPFSFVYHASGFTSSVTGGGRVRNYAPINVADPGIITSFGNAVVKFKLEAGGTGTSDFVDLTLELYTANEALPFYTAAGLKGPTAKLLPGAPIKVKTKGFSTTNTMGYQGRMQQVAGENADDVYEALMTRDGALYT